MRNFSYVKLGSQKIFKIALVPRQVPTSTTDTGPSMYSYSEPVQCKYSVQGAVHDNICIHQCTLEVECISVVLSGMDVLSVNLMVSAQDRHKYITCHSLICPGNTKHSSACIIYILVRKQ